MFILFLFRYDLDDAAPAAGRHAASHDARWSDAAQHAATRGPAASAGHDGCGAHGGRAVGSAARSPPGAHYWHTAARASQSGKGEIMLFHQMIPSGNHLFQKLLFEMFLKLDSCYPGVNKWNSIVALCFQPIRCSTMSAGQIDPVS